MFIILDINAVFFCWDLVFDIPEYAFIYTCVEVKGKKYNGKSP